MRAARRAVQGAVLVLSVLLGLLFAVPGGSASAATYRVAMSGYAYRPATLTIPAGATVTWTNQDTAPHDVKTTSAPAAFHSPMLNKGGSWSFTFAAPGTYAYYCTVHPSMTARIVVEAAAPTPAHEHVGSGSSGHHTTVTSRPTTTRPPMPSPARSRQSTPSTSPTEAAQPASPPPTTSPTTNPQTQVTATELHPLDPLLLLTGIVAGVAVLCLLLVGSRASRASKEET